MNSSFQQLIEKRGVAVAPSVLSADFSCLEREIRAVEAAGADFLHLDVMDGNFVPNITFGPLVVEAIAKLTSLPLITHLMINEPEKFIDGFVSAGSAIVSFHFEAPDSKHERIIERLHALDCGAGIAINPDTPLSDIEHLLGRLDLLLIMTVYPGFGGQIFISDVLGKIEQAVSLRRSKGYRYIIEVDGGIKPENAASVRDAGGQILVAGTAVFKSLDYAGAIASIRG